MADKWIGDLIGALCSALGKFLGIDIFFYDIIAAIGTLLPSLCTTSCVAPGAMYIVESSCGGRQTWCMAWVRFESNGVQRWYTSCFRSAAYCTVAAARSVHHWHSGGQCQYWLPP
jgi:hypothetical protein